MLSTCRSSTVSWSERVVLNQLRRLLFLTLSAGAASNACTQCGALVQGDHWIFPSAIKQQVYQVHVLGTMSLPTSSHCLYFGLAITSCVILHAYSIYDNNRCWICWEFVDKSWKLQFLNAMIFVQRQSDLLQASLEASLGLLYDIPMSADIHSWPPGDTAADHRWDLSCPAQTGKVRIKIYRWLFPSLSHHLHFWAEFI